MQEENSIDSAGQSNPQPGTSFSTYKELSDDPGFLARIAAAGLQDPSPAVSTAIASIMTGKGVILQLNDPSNRTVSYSVPVVLGARDGATLILVPTQLEVEEAATVLNKLEIPVKSLTGDNDSVSDIEPGQVLVGIPSSYESAFLGDNEIPLPPVKHVVLNCLDNAPEPLHSEATPAEIVEGLLSRYYQEDSCQLIWFGSSEPLSFRNFLGSHLRDKGAIELNLDSNSQVEVQHVYYEVGGDLTAKPNALCDALDFLGLPSSVIFCNSPSDADLVEVYLKRRGIQAQKLIGHVPPRKVSTALSDIAEGRCTALVVTDISGRNIRVEDFEIVINHSVHSDPEVYIHRAGNPGPGSALNKVVSLVGPTDLGDFHYLKKLFDFEFTPGELPSEKDIVRLKVERLAEAPEAEGYDSEKYSELAKIALENDSAAAIVGQLLYQYLEVIPQLQASKRSPKGRDRDRDRGDRDHRDRDRGDRDDRDHRDRDRSSRRDDRQRGDSRNYDRDSRRGRGSDDRDDSRRGDRHERREQGPPPKKDVRFYVGHGLEGGFSEDRFREILGSAVSEEPLAPERISVRPHYSFIDFPEKSADTVLKSLESVEVASGEPFIIYRAATITAPRSSSEGESENSEATGTNDAKANGDAPPADTSSDEEVVSEESSAAAE